MNNNPSHAVVYYDKKKAGILSKTSAGYKFTYDPVYLTDPNVMPISLGMPLRPEKYESKNLFPFFDGLLPEGWLLDLICAAAKIDKNDGFGLLLHTGQDPIGAVSILPIKDNNG